MKSKHKIAEIFVLIGAPLTKTSQDCMACGVRSHTAVANL